MNAFISVAVKCCNLLHPQFIIRTLSKSESLQIEAMIFQAEFLLSREHLRSLFDLEFNKHYLHYFFI